MYSLGFDIGGTKCAVILGRGEVCRDASKQIIDKVKFATDVNRGWKSVVAELLFNADRLLSKNFVKSTDLIGVGISCGGPLSSEKGVIMCPPNLPDWDMVPITDIVSSHFGCKALLCNDANASAVAEWRFGAGRGTSNMIFLTFGTGMGAGLILGGRLYSGTNDLAGEVGHIRLADDGPVGYGKHGSFEGFCSGGGIAEMAKSMAKEAILHNETGALFDSEKDIDALTAQSVALAREAGDEFAERVFERSAEYLARGLSVLIDILNPEVIVIGSIFSRNAEYFTRKIQSILKSETLPGSLEVCRIVPAQLGESIGDFAALGILF